MTVSARRSDHFDGRRFHNPSGPEPQPFTAVPQLMMERAEQPWPRWVDGRATVPPARDAEAACVTFIGHATFQAHGLASSAFRAIDHGASVRLA